MVTRTTPWQAGTPCWVDMTVRDAAAAQAFYGPVLGWTFADSGEEFGHYTLCEKDGRRAAAISPMMPGMSEPTPWLVYVASDDAAATAKLVTDNGGSFVVEPMEIPGTGTMAVAVDPTGGTFGIWQAGGVVGFEVANEPGGVTWTDTRLTDPAVGMPFYASVFGYSYQEIPGVDDYGMMMVEGVEGPVGGMGGMMGAREGTPSHWLAYFSVPDVDAAVELVLAGGGSVVHPAEDTPFGRIGMYADPTGVVFGMASAPTQG